MKRITMEQRSKSSSPSPYQSLGDRPEMELDLWEGQFNLSGSRIVDGDDDSPEHDQETIYSGDTTWWGEDSAVSMSTVQQMQEAVRELNLDHETFETKYNVLKQDNDSLAKKIFVLEEIIRDMEIQNINANKESEKKIKELEAKCTRTNENSELLNARLLEVEADNATLVDKNNELNEQLTRLKIESSASASICVNEDLYGYSQNFSRLDKSETDSGCHLQDTDDQDIASDVSELQAKLSDLETELNVVKELNKNLLEQNKPSNGDEKNLAQELRESLHQNKNTTNEEEIESLKKSLSSQEDVNHQLQKYIDAVILNIMEKNPELLEVKPELKK